MALYQGVNFESASGRAVLQLPPWLHHAQRDRRPVPVKGASHLIFAVVDIGTSYCAQTSVSG